MLLHITPTTKSVHIRPKTKDELKRLIDAEITRQGPDADLNFIDTSLITSMYMLFCDTGIRNIKIDQWDVSNVEDMAGMFMDCPGFNCDLSTWNTSSLVDTRSMLMAAVISTLTCLNGICLTLRIYLLCSTAVVNSMLIFQAGMCPRLGT